MEVRIRFNTNYDGVINTKKWRLIIDWDEKLVDEIQIIGKCFTSSEIMEEVGLKHHIGCKAKSIAYDMEDNKEMATIYTQ
jgi:hypothetical protein